MNNNNENASVGVTFKFGNKQGVSAEFGVIESNPNAPYNPNNNLKLYDSKDTYNRIPSVNAIVCYIHCDDFISNHTNNNTKQSTIDSNSIFSNIESTNQNNTNKPFNYKDSHITAKEIINNDNTSTLVIESKTNLLEYQGNTADTLMTGLSAMFASMATLAEKYEVDKTLKEVAKGALGSKGRILSSVLFQTEGASVSLAYNYGNNGNDMLKAGVSVGIELFTGWVAGVVATALIPASAPVLAFVGVSALAAVGIGYFLNTKAGKWVVNGITEYLVKPLIDSIESKLQSFFSMFDSNPLEYELVPNPTLESKDYQSLIELLLNKNSNALDIDTLLHTFPNYLAYPTHATTNSTNSSLALYTPKEALPIHITAQCFNHKNEPLANKEIYVYSPNFYSFVDRARSDDNGYIVFNNACVSSNMTNSDLYFVLNRCGLDEEQKDFHIKISPSKTIQPKDKKAKELLEQRLSFEKNIPKAITLNDNIKPNIKVISIECKDIKYTHNNANTQVKVKSNTPHNITMNNTSIKSHHTNNTIESITLKAHYVLRDSQRQYIQGDETTYTQDSIQRHKHKTKWGYIVFDKEEDIEQTLKQLNKTQPLIYSKRFKELENIKGEIVNIPFKEEWENKQIRFFAYLWRANRDVGIDVEKREYSYIIQVVHTKQEEKAWYENEKLWNTIDAVSLGAAFIPVGGWTAGMGIKAGAEGAKVAIRWASKKLTTRTLKLRNTQNKITIQQYEYKITKYITRSTNRVAKPKYPKQSLSQMPQHVRARYEERVASNWKRSKGVPDKKLEAGRKWKNDIAQLPTRDTKGNPIFYKEHDISIASSQSGRGAERIVVGHSQDGNVLYDYIYYTPNHYNDFIHLIPK
ncbi:MULTISPECIES: ribonuclease domain-containing protein [Helicobacter]|uniref:Uncharacterized protein n=1 Tax=Helicobacter bilis ATCC 43879 TaxID=613026 RepID=T5LNQ2_9HELI|nr:MULTISPECIES: ribonuclease domain-containing protein [Helicobacter]EQM94579.1 hypothetical protein HRAG_02377 [Helicobacter bilis ATCC 43879]